MAKVFTKPINKGTTSRRLMWDSDGKGVDQYIDMAPYLHSEIMRSIEAEEYEVDDATRQVIDDILSTRSAAYLKRIRAISSAFKRISKGSDILFDGDAVFACLSHIMSPAISVKAHPRVPHLQAMDLTAALFKMGYTGGYGSPMAADRFLKSADIASICVLGSKRAIDLISLSDEIRLGAHPRGTAHALKMSIFLSESVDVDDLEVKDSSLKRIIPGVEMHSIGEYFVMQAGKHCCVLSPQARHNLAECIHSIAGRALAAGLDERKGAKEAGSKTLEYAILALRSRLSANKDPQSLARCLKSSYAVRLCDMQDSADAATLALQRVGLVKEVDAVRHEQVPFHDVLASLPDDLALDYGTAWNILPPPDVDLAALASTLEKKMNAARVYDREAWDDFISYTLSQITVNYLLANPAESVTWANGDAEGEQWVINTRAGTRTAPSKQERNWMVGKLPWKRHLENWHHTAQDVTHVYADMSMYNEGSPPLDNSHSNELVYVLHHGRLLSGKYTPEFIRSSWESGHLPGDRVLFAAGKAENTKYGDKTRETMSADDVLRECLTEIDINAAAVSRYCNGVAMRAGRAGTERLISDVVSEAAGGSILLSMDISGWSPNMVREGEMQFADALMSLFDIPPRMRASAAFRDLNIVFKREGFYRKFVAGNGSVQGFFGTVDTILHSMMSLWVLNAAKSAGAAPADSKLVRVALIDDILLAVKHGRLSMSEVIDMFIAGYRKLGFTVDIVKTLAGNRTGVFLNRVYTSKGEITTSCKIFAAADREWERQVIGIDDECSSILAGFAGATDRGYSAVRAYYMACHRISQRCIAACYPDSITSKAIFAIMAFLPSGVGGLNLPDISTWLTESGGGPASARFATVYSVRAHALANDQQLYMLINKVMSHLIVNFDNDASAWAKASIPDGVSCKGVTNPASIIAGYARKAVRAIKSSNDITSLLSLTVDDGTNTYIDRMCRSVSMDAHLLSDFMATLPFAVSEAMMSRFIRSDACYSIMRVRDRVACRNRVRVHSRSTIKSMSACASDAAVAVPDSPTEIVRVAISRRLAGWALSNVVIPAITDLCRHAPGSTDIVAGLSSFNGRSPSGGPSAINRTFSSSAVVKGQLPNEREVSPLHSAFRKAAMAVSFLATTGVEPSILWSLFEATWGVPFKISIAVSVPDVNPRRVSLKTAHRAHSVRGYTNCAKCVGIDMSGALKRLSASRINIDFMAIRAWLQASMLVDADMGMPVGTQRAYEIYTGEGFFGVGVATVIGEVPNAAILTRATTNMMGGIVNSMSASITSVEIVTSDFGAISYTYAKADSAPVLAGAVSIRAIVGAIQGSGWAVEQVPRSELTDDDAAPVFRVERRPEYDAIRSVCSRAKNMTKQEFADFAQNMSKAAVTAAKKTGIPELERTVRRMCAGSDKNNNARAAGIALDACIETAFGPKRGFLSNLRNSYAATYLGLANVASEEDNKPAEYNYRLKSAMCKAAADHNSPSGPRSLVSAAYGAYSQVVSFIRRDIAGHKVPFSTAFDADNHDFVSACVAMARAVIPRDWADLAIILTAVENAATDFEIWVHADDAAIGAASAGTELTDAPAPAPAFDFNLAVANFGGVNVESIFGVEEPMAKEGNADDDNV